MSIEKYSVRYLRKICLLDHSPTVFIPVLIRNITYTHISTNCTTYTLTFNTICAATSDVRSRSRSVLLDIGYVFCYLCRKRNARLRAWKRIGQLFLMISRWLIFFVITTFHIFVTLLRRERWTIFFFFHLRNDDTKMRKGYVDTGTQRFSGLFTSLL